MKWAEKNRNQENGMNNDVWIDSGIKAWIDVVEWMAPPWMVID